MQTRRVRLLQAGGDKQQAQTSRKKLLDDPRNGINNNKAKLAQLSRAYDKRGAKRKAKAPPALPPAADEK